MNSYDVDAQERLERMCNSPELCHLHYEIIGAEDRVEVNEMMLRALKKEIERGKTTLVALRDAYSLLDENEKSKKK